MRKNIHKAISLFMAVLVLASTLSFTVGMHFCGDHMVDFSFLKDSKTCGMEAKMAKTPAKTDFCTAEISQKSCCSDKQVVVKGQDDLKVSFADFQLQQQVFVASFVYTYLSLFEAENADFIPYQTYRPPHLQRDVQVLHQSFLI